MGSSPWSNQIVSEVIVVTQPNNAFPGGVLVYQNSVALGNLIASILPNSSTDSVGNTLAPGITSYITNGPGQPVQAASLEGGLLVFLTAPTPSTAFTSWTSNIAVTLDPTNGNGVLSAKGTNLWEVQAPLQIQDYMQVGQTSAPPSNTAGLTGILTDINSVLRAIAGCDQNTYDMQGWVRNIVSSTITINSTSPIVIVQQPVAAIQYRMHCQLIYLGGATAASAIIGWDGNAAVSNVVGTLRRGRGNGNTDNVLPVNQNSAIGNLPLAFIAGELDTYEFDGMVTFSSAGTFSIRGQEGTAGDTWAVAINSYMEMQPT